MINPSYSLTIPHPSARIPLILSDVWNCLFEINRIFRVSMWQWTKPGSITTLWSQSGRQPSGLQSVRSVQSGQKRKCGPIRLWPQYFGMLIEFCSSTTLKKVRRSIANVILANWCVWKTKSVRNGSKWRRTKCSFTKTMRRVTSLSLTWRNWINRATNCFRTQPFSPNLAPSDYYLFADLKNSPRKEILLQRGSHHRNERLYQGQR